MCQDENENEDENQSFGWFWNLCMTNEPILQSIILLRAWFVRHRLYPERTKTFVYGFVFALAHEQPISLLLVVQVRTWSKVIWSMCPFLSLTLSTVSSWKTTATLSRVRATSNSTHLAPFFLHSRRDSRVFSGASSPAPRCATKPRAPLVLLQVQMDTISIPYNYT